MLKQITVHIGIILLLLVAEVHALQAQGAKNSIETGGRIDNYTDGVSDRYFVYLQYGRKFNDHELFFRLNSAWRLDVQGFQYEVDFYPKFSKRAYGYFNISYSNSTIFPQWRTAAEYFTAIGEKWEASIGVRTIHPPDYSIIAPTGTVGVYLGSWYMYLRPTLNILRDGVSTSWLFDARWYWSDRSYLQFLIFRGVDTGAVRDFGAIENTLGLDTYLGRVAANFDINNKTVIKVGTDYSALFIPERDTYIKDWAVDITLRRNF